MTESEKFDLILSKIQDVKEELQDVKVEVQDVKEELQDVKRRVTGVELHIENVTDKNIQLIAENFVELTNKLNQAIPVADKNLAYEVKVNYLINEVNKLKTEVAAIKDRTA